MIGNHEGGEVLGDPGSGEVKVIVRRADAAAIRDLLLSERASAVAPGHGLQEVPDRVNLHCGIDFLRGLWHGDEGAWAGRVRHVADGLHGETIDHFIPCILVLIIVTVIFLVTRIFIIIGTILSIVTKEN